MDANVKEANKIQIEKVIKNLERRNITGHYCETAADVSAKVLSLIDEGAEVSWGGSATLNEIGVKDAVKAGNYKVTDPMDLSGGEDPIELRRKSLTCDVFLASTNAVTMDGVLVNIDGTGNRVAAMMFGPKKVILIAGINKLAADEESALRRVKQEACPPNCIRLGKKTPCAVTGECGNCLTPGQTICSYTVSTRFSPEKDRLHVILVNDILGF